MDQDQFVRQITALQDRLFAYILTLLPDITQAADVLQEANVVLWRKIDEADQVENFEAWACRIAYFEVLSHRRDRGRERLVFDDALLTRIADRFPSSATADSDIGVALEHCLARLSPEQRELIAARYQQDQDVAALAATSGNSANAVAVTLHRIRRNLLDCIRLQVRKADA